MCAVLSREEATPADPQCQYTQVKQVAQSKRWRRPLLLPAALECQTAAQER
jgi:hypothetical protein